MLLPQALSALRSAICFCMASAHSTAETMEGNSISIPSPIVLNNRPPSAARIGATASRRSRTARAVPASSSPIMREYPTTSAARIAASLRTSATLLLRPQGNVAQVLKPLSGAQVVDLKAEQRVSPNLPAHEVVAGHSGALLAWIDSNPPLVTVGLR